MSRPLFLRACAVVAAFLVSLAGAADHGMCAVDNFGINCKQGLDLDVESLLQYHQGQTHNDLVTWSPSSRSLGRVVPGVSEDSSTWSQIQSPGTPHDDSHFNRDVGHVVARPHQRAPPSHKLMKRTDGVSLTFDDPSDLDADQESSVDSAENADSNDTEAAEGVAPDVDSTEESEHDGSETVDQFESGDEADSDGTKVVEATESEGGRATGIDSTEAAEVQDPEIVEQPDSGDDADSGTEVAEGSEPNDQRTAGVNSSEANRSHVIEPGTAPATSSRNCLCVFDIDRTLTGEQGHIAECPRNKLVKGVTDDAYGGGQLTLSALAAGGISKTFCGSCYLGLCSHGQASGAGSSERKYLLDHVMSTKQQAAFQSHHSEAKIWSEATNVRSPLVINSPNSEKPASVERIRLWYESKGVNIQQQDVYFFGDHRDNIKRFTGAGLNAREISCISRDRKLYGGSGMVGLCGATPEEIVDVKGVHDCSGERPGEKCHTAIAGEKCFAHVQWAKTTGIHSHKEWYPGLSSSSTFEEFQALLHGSSLHQHHCTFPCFSTCHTAKDGEVCYRHVKWAMEVGVEQHPEWYGNLNKTSSAEDFQIFLYQQNLHGCAKPC